MSVKASKPTAAAGGTLATTSSRTDASSQKQQVAPSPDERDGDVEDDDAAESLKKKRGVGKWRQRLGFSLLCLAVVISAAVFSLLAPFYPEVAANNGLSDGTVGLIFAIFALMVMVVSPYLGVKMDDIGSRSMMIIGLGVLSLSTIAFSALNSFSPEYSNTFLAISLVLRILQGIGAAGSETASYALAAQLYPDDLSYSVGFMETMCVPLTRRSASLSVFRRLSVWRSASRSVFWVCPASVGLSVCRSSPAACWLVVMFAASAVQHHPLPPR